MLTAKPLRIAVLCSSRAPGFEELVRNHARGNLFEIACVVTSEELPPPHVVTAAPSTPVIVHPLRAFHRARAAKLRDMDVRSEYDRETLAILRAHQVDAVVLLGYLYIVTAVLLAEFPGRVVNVHDSDLALRAATGEPRYAGLRSTLDAIRAGERETRSTVHFVSDRLDAGPVILRSDAYPVPSFVKRANEAGAIDIVKAFAYAQREWMMRDCWGELVVDALEHIAAGFGPEDAEAWLEDEALLMANFARLPIYDAFEQGETVAFAEAG